MSVRAGLAVLAAGAALLATGCGGGSGGHGATSGTAGAAAAEATAVESGFTRRSADGTVRISMSQYDYSPAMATVKAGQKIVWRNRGAITHDIRAIRGGDFRSKTLHKGDTFETTVKTPGLVDYECTLHPGMLGSIVVE